MTVNDTPGLPAGIKTERLLYGGGLAIVGNTADPNLEPAVLAAQPGAVQRTPRTWTGRRGTAC